MEFSCSYAMKFSLFIKKGKTMIDDISHLIKKGKTMIDDILYVSNFFTSWVMYPSTEVQQAHSLAVSVNIVKVIN